MSLVISLIILMFSVIIHEVAHGWMADLRGDDTARVMGRLTLNPLPHIDIIGTLVLPAITLLSGSSFFFGWAKPVPVNPYRLDDPRRDMILVSIAGVGANFLLAVIAAALLWGMRLVQLPLMFANPLFNILNYILVINLVLGVFNLIPVPPLDGSKVLMGLLPSHLAYRYGQLEQYGFIIVIMLLVTGVLGRILGPVVGLLLSLLGGGIGYL